MPQLQKKLLLPFTKLDFYKDFIISEPLEGVVIGNSEMSEITGICTNHYTGRNFIYISHRVYNFSVDPMVYHNLEKVKNLKGFAVVSQKSSSLNMAAFERNFSKIPFELFLDLEKAQEWIQKLLANE